MGDEGSASTVALDALADRGYRAIATPVEDPVRGAVLLAERALDEGVGA